VGRVGGSFSGELEIDGDFCCYSIKSGSRLIDINY